MGPVSFEVLDCAAAADDAIRQAVAEKCRWLDARGRQNRVLCCPLIGEFLNALPRSGDGLQRVVSVLRAGGTPVSWRSDSATKVFTTASSPRIGRISPITRPRGCTWISRSVRP